MITPRELLCVILAPVLVAFIIGGVGAWRRWFWAMPLAVGVAYIVGYALLGSPGLPPRDGNDWLFWIAPVATLLGVTDALIGGKWRWILGAAGGAAAYVIVRPLIPGALSGGGAVELAAALGAAGVLHAAVASLAERRMGSLAVAGGYCIALGAAAVVVLSSNLRIAGVVGIAASAAVGPVALCCVRVGGGRSVAVVCIPLLCALLACGRYYPDPGVTWLNFAVVLAAPLLLLCGFALPAKRQRFAAVAALLAIFVAVAIVTAPTALAAKRAAEGNDSADPYGR